MVPTRVQPHNHGVGRQKGVLAKKIQLDVSDLILELLQLLLQVRMLLCHFFVFLLPLIALILEGLDLAFEMSGLDISLPKPIMKLLAGCFGGAGSTRQEARVVDYMAANILLVGLAESLVSLLSLVF